MQLLEQTSIEELRSMKSKELSKFLSMIGAETDKAVSVVDKKDRTHYLKFVTLIEGEKWGFQGSKGNYYIVQRNGDVNNRERTGMLSCNCPSWIFNNGSNKRFCKHCKAVMVSGELDFHQQHDILDKREQVFQDKDIW